MSAKMLKSQCFFFTLVVIAASGYGLSLYELFNFLFSQGADKAGVMLASFLFGVPFSTSALVCYMSALRGEGKFLNLLIINVAVFVVICFFAYFIFHEGSICIILLAGCIIIPTIIGGCLGLAVGRMKRLGFTRKLVIVIALLPLMTGNVEAHINPSVYFTEIHRSIFIAAPPNIVWNNLLHISAIRSEEVEQGFAYKIGGPKPLEANIDQLKIGGIRKSVWERGVTFDEEITDYQDKKYIKWVYHFNDRSFPPGSLDEHVKIGGKYFDLKDTQYSLRPSNGGTYLDVSVRYRVSTNFNWYAEPLAKFFVINTTDTLLSMYKERSENKSQNN